MVTTTLLSLATFVSGGIIGYGLYAAGKKAGFKLGKEQAEMEANLQVLPHLLASLCLGKVIPFNTAAPPPQAGALPPAARRRRKNHLIRNKILVNRPGHGVKLPTLPPPSTPHHA